MPKGGTETMPCVQCAAFLLLHVGSGDVTGAIDLDPNELAIPLVAVVPGAEAGDWAHRRA